MDPFSFFSGLFSTGADLWMNEKNNDLQEYLAGQQMKFQHNEAELDRKWQEQMQDKMNAYNSAPEQMRRLIEAGLNPYLLSGSQIVGEGTAATPPSGAQAGSTSLPNTHPGYIDPLMAAQIANLDAQTAETYSRIPFNDQQTAKMKQESDNLAKQGQMLDLDLKKYLDTIDSTIQSINESNSATSESAKFTKEEIIEKRKYLSQNFENMAKEIKQKAREAEAYADKAIAEKKVAEEQRDLVVQQKAFLKKRQEELEEVIKKLKKDNTWYTADKIVGYFNDFCTDASNILHGVGSLTNIAGNQASPVDPNRSRQSLSRGISPNYNFDMQ